MLFAKAPGKDFDGDYPDSFQGGCVCYDFRGLAQLELGLSYAAQFGCRLQGDVGSLNVTVGKGPECSGRLSASVGSNAHFVWGNDRRGYLLEGRQHREICVSQRVILCAERGRGIASSGRHLAVADYRYCGGGQCVPSMLAHKDAMQPTIQERPPPQPHPWIAQLHPHRLAHFRW